MTKGCPLNEAIHRFGSPVIMNTDQGSQFTSFAWTDRLKRVGTRISMDGKGRCIDNVFIERLWRSPKYECVYLHAWEAESQAKAAIGCLITFYNHLRPHGGPPPAVVYFNRSAGTGSSIRCQQAVFGVHFLLSRRSALARTMSFRMIAVIATFAAFPVAISVMYFSLSGAL